MTSYALRFLVVVVKIAQCRAIAGSVKKSAEAPCRPRQATRCFTKFNMCSIATKIQRNSAWSFFFDKQGIAKSVVNEHFKGKLFFQILNTEYVGKRVLTMCQYNFPREKKNRRGEKSF